MKSRSTVARGLVILTFSPVDLANKWNRLPIGYSTRGKFLSTTVSKVTKHPSRLNFDPKKFAIHRIKIDPEFGEESHRWLLELSTTPIFSALWRFHLHGLCHGDNVTPEPQLTQIGENQFGLLHTQTQFIRYTTIGWDAVNKVVQSILPQSNLSVQ